MTEKTHKKNLILRVQKAKERDIGKNIIRIDPKTMEDHGIKTGDVIAIKGKKESAGIAWPSFPQDHGLGIVRFDSRLRKNTDTNIDDNIEIRKINALAAQNVVLAPIFMKIKSNPQFETFVKRKLINYPVTLNDIIYMSVGISREISFKVTSLKPKGICQIKQETIIHVSESVAIDKEELEMYITYKDVGGLANEIQRIREVIEIPLNQPTIIKKLHLESSCGILLTGPPGCGKTLLAEAIMNESGIIVFPISGPDILGKYKGESEKKLRKLFEEARERSPSIIYIDQLDSIGANRDLPEGKIRYSIVSELLSLMDGIHKRRNVFVIGATNKPDIIDPALRRPGRFEVEIEIKIPNKEARLDIFKIHTREIPLSSDVILEEIAEKTDGITGADVSNICKEAKLNAIKRNFSKEQLESEITEPSLVDQIEISMLDFEIALKNINKK